MGYGIRSVQRRQQLSGRYRPQSDRQLHADVCGHGRQPGLCGDGYSHSLVLDVSVTDRLNYVLQSDYVSTNGNYDVATGRFFGRVWNDDIGVNQYLIYRLNDCWGVGGRLEWWKQDGVSVNEWTVGVNYKPLANFIVRPEFRQQWSPAANYQEAIFGMDAIITY